MSKAATTATVTAAAVVVVMMMAACMPGAEGLDRPRGSKVRTAGSNAYPERFYTQKLDHFDPSSQATFQQRYFEVLTHFTDPDGPLILYVAGEAPQDGPAGVDDELAVLAERLGAAVLTPEHRYFGKSAPFAQLTTANLRWLTVAQELEDLAAFTSWYINTQIPGKRGPPNKVVAIGGSYAGMISSHLRYAHPEVITAAWSSSGVVNAVFNFSTFDLQVVTSLGQECVEVVRRASEGVESLLASSPATNAKVKALFGATGMSDDDLMWMLSDAETLPPQYGRKYSLCDPMIAAKNRGDDLVMALATFCNQTFYPMFCAGAGPFLYSDELMQRTDASLPYISQRTWWWMVSNELSYAQTYPGPIGVRSPRITIDFHRRKSDHIFGAGVWPPNTEAFNNKYGGSTPKATNVVYINGSQDPWQWAGVRRTLSSTQPAVIMVGPEVGHCLDLHAPSPSDPVEVVAARRFAEDFIINVIKSSSI